MAPSQIKGKSIQAVAKDIAEGYLVLNPLILKKFDLDSYKALHFQLRKTQNEARGQHCPPHDMRGLRRRNITLQRLHQALIVLEHSAREKKIVLV